jgi:ABC-2 type transport system permease protein
VVLSLIGATAGLLGQLPRILGGSISADTVPAIGRVLRWSPPGMLGHALFDAERHRLGPLALELVVPAAFVLLLLVAWAANLDRLLTTVGTSEAPRRRRRARDAGLTLYPRSARFLPRDRRGAVAAKELRLLSREPLSRSQRIVTAVLAVGAIGAVAFVPRFHHPQLVVGTAGVLWWFNIQAFNQFGPDRAAYWMNVAAGGDPRDDLIGKNVAGFLVHLPVFALLAVGTAATTGGWAYLPLAVCFGVAVLGCQFGVANVASVHVAQPLPESSSNPWAMRSGQGLAAGFTLLGAFLFSGIMVAPVAILIGVGLTTSPVLLWVAAPVGVLYGSVVYVIGLRVASAWLREHQPELLERLSPARAA